MLIIFKLQAQGQAHTCIQIQVSDTNENDFTQAKYNLTAEHA